MQVWVSSLSPSSTGSSVYSLWSGWWGSGAYGPKLLTSSFLSSLLARIFLLQAAPWTFSSGLVFVGGCSMHRCMFSRIWPLPTSTHLPGCGSRCPAIASCFLGQNHPSWEPLAKNTPHRLYGKSHLPCLLPPHLYRLSWEHLLNTSCAGKTSPQLKMLICCKEEESPGKNEELNFSGCLLPFVKGRSLLVPILGNL